MSPDRLVQQKPVRSQVPQCKKRNSIQTSNPVPRVLQNKKAKYLACSSLASVSDADSLFVSLWAVSARSVVARKFGHSESSSRSLRIPITNKVREWQKKDRILRGLTTVDATFLRCLFYNTISFTSPWAYPLGGAPSPVTPPRLKRTPDLFPASLARDP